MIVPGNVVINKVAVNGNGTFAYTGTGTGIDSSFGITTSGGTGSISFLEIPPGTKTVTETGPTSPWAFTV